MENFSELIKNRRSMRKFTDEELTQDQVVTLMKAALMSPSSKRSNSWQFVVIDDKEVLKELSHCKEQASSFIADAALAIVVMADPLASDVRIEDASIASIMIQLQAEDLGLGSCWVQVRERFTATGMPSDEFVHGILGIPLQLQILSVIAIGHKGMDRKPCNEEQLLAFTKSTGCMRPFNYDPIALTAGKDGYDWTEFQKSCFKMYTESDVNLYLYPGNHTDYKDYSRIFTYKRPTICLLYTSPSPRD